MRQNGHFCPFEMKPPKLTYTFFDILRSKSKTSFLKFVKMEFNFSLKLNPAYLIMVSILDEGRPELTKMPKMAVLTELSKLHFGGPKSAVIDCSYLLVEDFEKSTPRNRGSDFGPSKMDIFVHF